MGSEYWRNAFRPLLPDIFHLEYNSKELLEEIDANTACVILETVQAEAGVIVPDKNWLQSVRKKCTETGALLLLDEIQTGFGRTGKLWGFKHFDIVPDVLLLGKALGGGMPLGAFIADKKLMTELTDNPVLGHITTFGGHPVCCTAGLASFKILTTEKIYETVNEKERLFISILKHPKIKAVRSFGLLIAVEFEDFETNKKIIDLVIEKGTVTDWFLFADNCLRICPPLTISEEEIKKACAIIIEALNSN